MRSIKIVIKLLIVVCAFSFTQAQSGSDNLSEKLTGKWENKKFQISYEFYEDSTVYFSQGGFGQRMEYVLDDSKTPIWIDFKVKQGNYATTIPGLLKITDENTIIIEQFPPSSDHPIAFSEDDSYPNKRHTLTKVD